MENDPQVRAGLSQRLQELRLENQMTQAELARLCDIPQPVLSLYEKADSNRMPTLYGLVKLANVLRVSTDYLLGRTNERTGSASFLLEDSVLKELSVKDRQILIHIAKALLLAAKTKQEIMKSKKIPSKAEQTPDTGA